MTEIRIPDPLDPAQAYAIEYEARRLRAQVTAALFAQAFGWLRAQLSRPPRGIGRAA